MPRRKSVITEKQQAFADTLLAGGTMADASRASGTAHTNATLSLRSKGVQQVLKEGRDEIENVTTLKRVDVLNGFLEAVDMARLIADPNGMIAGWDKVAKMMGYYAPETRRIELSADQSNLSKKLEQLPDSELLEMLQKRSLLIDVASCDVTDVN